MRRSMFPVAALFAMLAGCVTINVYFPAAAAQQAAEQIIGNVIGPDASAPASSVPASSAPTSSAPASSAQPSAQHEPLALRLLDAVIPAAYAAEPDLDIHTPAIDAIQARMQQRYRSVLGALLDSGAVGLTRNGDVALRDPSKVPLAQRAAATQAVAAENADRAALYQQIGAANGHPEWAASLREAFAKKWIGMAHAGWYYQDANGAWKQK